MSEVINLEEYRIARARREEEERDRSKAREAKRPKPRKGLPRDGDQVEEDPTPA